jgi:hypothetical protein
MSEAITILEKDGWDIDSNRKYVLWKGFLYKAIKFLALDKVTQERVEDLKSHMTATGAIEDRVAVFETATGWGIQRMLGDFVSFTYEWDRVESYLVMDF